MDGRGEGGGGSLSAYPAVLGVLLIFAGLALLTPTISVSAIPMAVLAVLVIVAGILTITGV
jgi:hypothetical protein